MGKQSKLVDKTSTTTRSMKRQAILRTRSELFGYPQYLQQLGERHVSKNNGSVIDIVARRSELRKSAIVASTIEEAGAIARTMQASNPHSQLPRTTGLTFFTPTSAGKTIAVGPNDTVYHENLRFGESGVSLREQSPVASGTDCSAKLFKVSSRGSSKKFFDSKSKETIFSFVVRKEILMGRRNKKRSCTQRKVAGDSAANIFRDIGLTIDKKEDKYYHLAHRFGWALGGLQIIDNLDPATAGSNYTTLFYIEDVIRSLIVETGFPEVHVKGQIVYHAIHTSLPETITYTYSWGEAMSMQKTIYPLSTRRPTRQENEEAKALASAISQTLDEDAVLEPIATP